MNIPAAFHGADCGFASFTAGLSSGSRRNDGFIVSPAPFHFARFCGRRAVEVVTEDPGSAVRRRVTISDTPFPLTK